MNRCNIQQPQSYVVKFLNLKFVSILTLNSLLFDLQLRQLRNKIFNVHSDPMTGSLSVRFSISCEKIQFISCGVRLVLIFLNSLFQPAIIRQSFISILIWRLEPHVFWESQSLSGRSPANQNDRGLWVQDWWRRVQKLGAWWLVTNSLVFDRMLFKRRASIFSPHVTFGYSNYWAIRINLLYQNCPNLISLAYIMNPWNYLEHYFKIPGNVFMSNTI